VTTVTLTTVTGQDTVVNSGGFFPSFYHPTGIKGWIGRSFAASYLQQWSLQATMSQVLAHQR